MSKSLILKCSRVCRNLYHLSLQDSPVEVVGISYQCKNVTQQPIIRVEPMKNLVKKYHPYLFRVGIDDWEESKLFETMVKDILSIKKSCPTTYELLYPNLIGVFDNVIEREISNVIRGAEIDVNIYYRDTLRPGLRIASFNLYDLDDSKFYYSRKI